MASLSRVLIKRAIGAGMIVLGVIALSAPLAVGHWSLALLGIPLLALSMAEAYAAFTSPQRGQLSAYLPSVLAMLAANLLLISSALVISGLLILLIAILVGDGLSKILTIWRTPLSDRAPAVANGLVDFACAALLWYLARLVGAEQAIGIIIGAFVAAAGWRLLMAPTESEISDIAVGAPNIHPDPGLGLAPTDAFKRLRTETDNAAPTIRASDLMWILTLIGVFLAIHLGRMPISDTLLGIASPFVATAGDILMTLVFASLVVLPWRLLWRRGTRPIERLAWSLQFDKQVARTRVTLAAHWVISRWLASRFGFSQRLREARVSLFVALLLLLRLGLPVTAFFVAFNPIWGFSWYFNTESWASGVYQKLTALRVDTWRVSMVDAVTRVYGEGDELFRVRPDGVDGSSDFSFIVMGDTGEGDASQYSLVSQFLKLGFDTNVKFLVVSSDVVYPAGSMDNYESNFYLPFQGFAQPIYAIPGNHDWFDALEGFNANFLEPKAAKAAIAARVDADLNLTSTNQRRIDRLLTEAARLRGLYGVKVGAQRAAFFELQTNDFALLAIDTGIMRTVDERQWTWLERSLARSRGKFIMAIVGHPRFAGGYDTIPVVGGSSSIAEFPKDLGALYRLLALNSVPIVMAGDTHDFEYYREHSGIGDAASITHHFINGGGGAYLSIGTALDFPQSPPVADWAFYPRTDRLRAKMEAEMPLWKQPFWYWIKWFNAWPFSVEALSGLFDFNHAPFFQSFMEVRVERSKNRLVLALNGVDGPLRWQDLQTGGATLPAGTSPDDAVEFIFPMIRASN